MESELAGSLVTQAASGDEVAFTRIVAGHHDDMARICYVVCGDADLAQEAVYAAWPIVWRKIGSVRDPQRLRPWLLAVAANEARGIARRRSRRSLREITVEAMPEVPVDHRGGDTAERVDVVDLWHALARLEVDDRVIVGMRYIAGLSSVEIGQAIGMSDRGVRARLTRSLARLREDLLDG